MGNKKQTNQNAVRGGGGEELTGHKVKPIAGMSQRKESDHQAKQ